MGRFRYGQRRITLRQRSGQSGGLGLGSDPLAHRTEEVLEKLL